MPKDPKENNQTQQSQPVNPKPMVKTYRNLAKYHKSNTYKNQLYANFPKTDRTHPLQRKDVNTAITTLDLAFRHAGQTGIDINVDAASHALEALLLNVKKAEDAPWSDNPSKDTESFKNSLKMCLLTIGVDNAFFNYMLKNFVDRQYYSLHDMYYFRQFISSMIQWRVEDPFDSWENWWKKTDTQKELKKLTDQFTHHWSQLSETLEKDADKIAQIVAKSWAYSTKKKSPAEIKDIQNKLRAGLSKLFEYEQRLKPCTSKEFTDLSNNIRSLFPDSTASWMPLFSYLQPDQPKEEKTPARLADYIRNYALIRLNSFIAEKDVSADIKNATLDNECGEVASDPNDVPFKSDDELKQYAKTIEQCYRMASEKITITVNLDKHIEYIKSLRKYAVNQKALLDTVEIELKNGKDRLTVLKNIPAAMSEADYKVETDLMKNLYPNGSANAFRVTSPNGRPFASRQTIANQLKDYAVRPKQRLAEAMTDILKNAVKENYSFHENDAQKLNENNNILEDSKNLGLLSHTKITDGKETLLDKEMQESLKDLTTWLNQSTDRLGKIERDRQKENFTTQLNLNDSKTIDSMINAKNGLKFLQYVAQKAGLNNLFSQSLYQRRSIANDLIYFKDFLYAKSRLMSDIDRVKGEMIAQSDADRKTDWANSTLDAYDLQTRYHERKPLADRADRICRTAREITKKGIQIPGLVEQRSYAETALNSLTYQMNRIQEASKIKQEEADRKARELEEKKVKFKETDFPTFREKVSRTIRADETQDWSKIKNLDTLKEALENRKELAKEARDLLEIAKEVSQVDDVSYTLYPNMYRNKPKTVRYLELTQSYVDSLNETIKKIEEIATERTKELEEQQARADKVNKEKERAENTDINTNINTDIDTDINTDLNEKNNEAKHPEDELTDPDVIHTEEKDKKTTEVLDKLDWEIAQSILNVDRTSIKKYWLTDKETINKCGKALNLIAAICNEVQKDTSSNHKEYEDMMKQMTYFKDQLQDHTELNGNPLLLTKDADYGEYSDGIIKAFTYTLRFRITMQNLYEACANYVKIHMDSRPSDTPNAPDQKFLTGQLTETGRIRKQAAVAIMCIFNEIPITERLINRSGKRDANLNPIQNQYAVSVQDLTDLKDSLSKGSHGPENYHGKSNPFYELYSPIVAARNQKLREQKESEQRAREQERKAQERREKEQRKNAKKKNAKKS